MTLEADFLTTAADKLAEMDRIETCLTELPPRSLWARDSENENAVGNLLLHLEGNVRQWILSGVGAGPDTRNRASEFSARAGASASELSAKLHGTVSEAVDLIRSLPHRRLAEEVSNQIILLTKRFTGRDLGFYGYLDKTGRREIPEDQLS